MEDKYLRISMIYLSSIGYNYKFDYANFKNFTNINKIVNKIKK